MLADASGRFAVAEYHDGIVELIENDVKAVTNFCLYTSLRMGVGQDRYAKIAETLNTSDGILTEEEALDLLDDVSIKGRTQWSVPYNLTTGEVKLFAREKRD